MEMERRWRKVGNGEGKKIEKGIRDRDRKMFEERRLLR
jgi:hypothetical protein